MNREHCLRFWAVSERKIWGVTTINIISAVKTLCHFHILLSTSFAHLLAIWIWWWIHNIGVKISLHQQAPHLKPASVCQVRACSWCWRKLTQEIWCNLHWKSHAVISEGFAYLPSFISMHTFTTWETSLMKLICVPDSVGHTDRRTKVVPDSEKGAGMKVIRFNTTNCCWLFTCAFTSVAYICVTINYCCCLLYLICHTPFLFLLATHRTK